MKKLLFTFIALFNCCLFAQTLDPYKFFPSAVGNVWEYSGIWGSREEIYRDSVGQDGLRHLFYKYNEYYPPYATFKIDSANNKVYLAMSTNFWQHVNFPQGGPIKNIEINYDGDIFIVNHQGFYRSTNNGGDWDTLEIAGNLISALAINSKKDIYIGYGYSLYRSTDNGNTWNNIGLNGLLVHAIAFNSFGHIFVSVELPDNSSIYRSTDNGNTWTNQGLTGSWSNIQIISINRVNTIFAVRDQVPENGLYLSYDNGETWNFRSFFVNHALAFDSINNILAGRADGIFYSTDDGVTWIELNNGITNTYTYALVINSLGHYFASTPDGVYRSTSSGSSWENISAGLTSKDIMVLTLNESGFVYAGSADGKLFRSINSTTSLGNSDEFRPKSFRLFQNYPNPFNLRTTIKFSIPEPQKVKLTVYSLLGEEIKVLVDEYKSTGSHSVIFDASGLPSGVYIYSLIAGNKTASKKLVLLK